MSVDSPLEGLGIRQGEVIAGKYQLSRVLGSGGMGIVVEAFHIHLEEKVAIKFLSEASLANPEVVARFAQEARAAAKIKSEHVARVFDVGSLDSGAPFMVMEFLEGVDLSTWLAERGPLDVELAVDFVLHAAEALAEAHSQGIVHRDLKPTNLFCIRRADGTLSVKVLDFGISKSLGWRPSTPNLSLTKTSAVMGSPLYISPEQMQSSKHVDARTDIWSLGVILYELLTGTVPFDGNNIAEVCSRVTTQPAAPLRRKRPDVPGPLESAVGRCLEKDRERRFRNVAELADAMAPYGSSRATESETRISRIMTGAGFASTMVASGQGSRHPLAGVAIDSSTKTSSSTQMLERRRQFGIILTVGLLAASVLLLMVGLAQQRRGPDPSLQPRPTTTRRTTSLEPMSTVSSVWAAATLSSEPIVVLVPPATTAKAARRSSQR